MRGTLALLLCRGAFGEHAPGDGAGFGFREFACSQTFARFATDAAGGRFLGGRLSWHCLPLRVGGRGQLYARSSTESIRGVRGGYFGSDTGRWRLPFFSLRARFAIW